MELYHYVEALYSSTSFALDKLGNPQQQQPTVTSQRRETQDPALGLVIEMAMATPVLCDVRTLDTLL